MNTDSLNLKTIELSYFIDKGIYFSLLSSLTSLKANRELRKKLSNCNKYTDPNLLLYISRYYSFLSSLITYLFVIKTLDLMCSNPATTSDSLNTTQLLLKFAFISLYISYISLNIAYSILNT